MAGARVNEAVDVEVLHLTLAVLSHHPLEVAAQAIVRCQCGVRFTVHGVGTPADLELRSRCLTCCTAVRVVRDWTKELEDRFA